MPFDPVEIDRFVEEEGDWVRHFVGTRCWCLTPDGQPSLTHTECEAGYLYRTPRDIIGLITAIDQQKLWLMMGIAQPGDCVFSPLTDEVALSDKDKIVFLTPFPISEGEVIVRTDGLTDPLHFEAVSAIYCEGVGGIVYQEGESFTLSGKTVTWLAGKPQPALGAQYTLKYYGLMEWLVFIPPMLRLNAGRDIGKKVLLRKKSIVAGTQ